MNSIDFVEDIQKITKERMLLVETYEKCCNDSELSIEDKALMLSNYEVAYDGLGYARDKMLKKYMKS